MQPLPTPSASLILVLSFICAYLVLSPNESLTSLPLALCPLKPHALSRVRHNQPDSLPLSQCSAAAQQALTHISCAVIQSFVSPWPWQAMLSPGSCCWRHAHETRPNVSPVQRCRTANHRYRLVPWVSALQTCAEPKQICRSSHNNLLCSTPFQTPFA